MSNITYFETKGNQNFDEVISVVAKYIENDNFIKNVVLFAGNVESALKLQNKLGIINDSVTITVTTYPYGRKFNKKDSDNFIIPSAATKEGKETIVEAGMNYIQGGLLFDPILSCTGDNSLEMIASAYATISKGLPLCINAAIMAFENGIVEENEQIIAISGDTAIVLTPTSKREIFCDNFKIHKILCMPL